MTPSLPEASSTLLAYLLHPAARALALAILTGIGLTAFRARSAAVRLLTWNAVLFTALAMPFLLWMLPPLPVPMPAFLRHKATPASAVLAGNDGTFRVRFDPRRSSSHDQLVQPSPTVEPGPAAKTRSWPPVDWTVIAAGIYLLIASILALRFLVGIAYCGRLVRASQRIDEPRLVLGLASRAYDSGLTVVPEARESELLCVPVTMGAIRSTILLPRNWRDWDDSKLDAVVAHEVSHVARRDALAQRLSLLHRAIFWFSPLSWWLDKHLADLAEEASDEAALSSGINRTEYAKTLLGFFEALQTAPGRVWWQGVSMAKAGQAEQRVDKILAWKGNVAMSLKKSMIAVIVVLALPFTYLAASVHLNSDGSASPQATAVQPVHPVAPVTPPTKIVRISRDGQDGEEHTYRIESDGSSSVLLSLSKEGDEQGKNVTTTHVRYHKTDSEEQDYVIVSGNSNYLTMSGSEEDAEHAKELKNTIHGDFIWFRRGDHSYVIKDQATVDRARKLWAEQEAISKQQEQLGQKQEELGKRQEELSTRMEKIQVQVPDMTAQLDKLKAELQQMNSSATMDQIGKIQEEIGELQEKIGEAQSKAGEEQGKLGEQMGTLGEQQGKLGEEQGRLGEQQEAMARAASRKMKQVLDEALAKGTAQAER